MQCKYPDGTSEWRKLRIDFRIQEARYDHKESSIQARTQLASHGPTIRPLALRPVLQNEQQISSMAPGISIGNAALTFGFDRS